MKENMRNVNEFNCEFKIKNNNKVADNLRNW